MGTLLETWDGRRFECLVPSEAEFLYEEIVTRRSYLQEGVRLPDGADPDAVVVDVGANIGLFAMLCAREQPGVDVHALEPVPVTHDVLARNVADCPRVYTHRLALRGPAAAERGAATLAYYPAMPGESTFHPDENAAQQELLARPPHRAELIQCDVATLSGFLAQQGIRRVGLLKVDVEGDEAEVLAGIADADWPRIDQVVVEVRDVDGRKAAIAALLRARGFTVRERAERSEVVAGYATVIPSTLRLYLLYAVRPTRAG